MATKTKRVNISIDDNLYKKLKAICFLENKSVSKYISKSVINSFNQKKTKYVEKLFISHDELKKMFNL